MTKQRDTSENNIDTHNNDNDNNNHAGKTIIYSILFTFLLIVSFILYFNYFSMVLEYAANITHMDIKNIHKYFLENENRTIEFSYFCLVISSFFCIISRPSSSSSSYCGFSSIFKYVPTYFGLSLLVVNLYNNSTHYTEIDALDKTIQHKLATTPVVFMLSNTISPTPMDTNANTMTDPIIYDSITYKNIHANKQQFIYNYSLYYSTTITTSSSNSGNNKEMVIDSKKYHEMLEMLKHLQIFKEDSKIQCILSYVMILGFVSIHTVCYLVHKVYNSEDEDLEENDNDEGVEFNYMGSEKV